MSRSIQYLREGRAHKIAHYLQRKYPKRMPWQFIYDYGTSAAYGKFNTKEDAERVYKLWKETNMTTKETNTVADLTNAVTVARQAEQQAEANFTKAQAAESSAFADLTNARSKHADAKAALGKAKLTEAIALIDKVHGESPKGSAAAKDIEGLLERIMQQRLMNAFKDLPYASPFVQVSQPARFSASNPNLQQVAKYGLATENGEKTAAAVKAETSVSVGGHQAKPTATPYIPEPGDKVTLLKAWYPEAKKYEGQVLTVKRVSQGMYVYFEELQDGANCRYNQGYFEKLQPTAPQCNYPNCACIGSQFCGVKA